MFGDYGSSTHTDIYTIIIVGHELLRMTAIAAMYCFRQIHLTSQCNRVETEAIPEFI